MTAIFDEMFQQLLAGLARGPRLHAQPQRGHQLLEMMVLSFLEWEFALGPHF